MNAFKNQHLSFSRLSRYERCPLSFRLHYIDGQESEPDVALRFGKAIHATLERAMREVVDAGRPSRLSNERVIEIFRDRWAAEGLSGFELFSEGLKILERFIHDEGIVNPADILAIEREFELPVGPFNVRGYIDRVNRIDDRSIEIIDYKTNHQLYTREQIDTSLQMSIYQVAAEAMWPWAKTVKLSFWMLRHGVRQETSRTRETLRDALVYIEALGRETESAESFPARLGPGCVSCDHRRQCPAYAEALRGKRDFVCENEEDLESVAREREEVVKLTKLLNARRAELESILKTHLAKRTDLVLGGVRYRMFNATSHEYPLEPTITLLAEASGLPREEVFTRLVSIDHKALEDLLREIGKKTEKARVGLLRAELDAHASKRFIPRLWATECEGQS